jgi:gas vesicle protein
MGEDPDAIRDEIADTRERMGDTIDALGYKADVKSRAKDNVSGKVEAVKERLGVAGQRASDATPDAGEVKHQVRRAAGVAQENPLGLAGGAVAVGFLVGLAVPSSSVEDEKLGPVADRVKDQAKETGQEALDRGKEVAQSAADTVSEEGRKHGEKLADSAKENAASVRQ